MKGLYRGLFAPLLLCFFVSCGGGSTKEPLDEELIVPGPGASAIFSQLSLSDGQELSGIVHVTGQAADPATDLVNFDAGDVQLFHYNGPQISYYWNTRGQPNGPCTVTMSARSGGQTRTETVQVLIDNSVPIPVPEIPEPPVIEPEPVVPKPPTPDPPEEEEEEEEEEDFPMPAVVINPPEVQEFGPDYDPTDKLAPHSVIISGIKHGRTVYGTVSFNVLGLDNKKVAEIAVFAGKGLIAQNLGQTISVNWDTREYPSGSIAISILCRDHGYNWGQHQLWVIIDNEVDHGPPEFHPTQTLIGGTYLRQESGHAQGLMQAQIRAHDDQRVVRCTIKIDGELIVDEPRGEFDLQWDTTKHANALYYFDLQAWDSAGKTARKGFFVSVRNEVPVGSISGRVTLPNGIDPAPLARVSAICLTPYGWEQYVETQTDADGSFSLEDVSYGPRCVFITSGDFGRLLPLEFEHKNLVLPPSMTRLEGGSSNSAWAPTIGLVTGTDEHAEDMLARWGLGKLDSAGRLIRGTEQFTIIDGIREPGFEGLDFMSVAENPGALAYFQLLLVCGGNAYEAELRESATARQNLKNWVRQGGILYCGGSSYDIAESVAPEKLNFFGGVEGAPASEPEPLNAAMQGPAYPAYNLLGQQPVSSGKVLHKLAWLKEVGFPHRDYEFMVNLPAGWLQIHSDEERTFIWGHENPDVENLSLMLQTDVEEDEYFSQWKAGRILVSALPVCAKPALQPHFEERLLTYALFEISNAPQTPRFPGLD